MNGFLKAAVSTGFAVALTVAGALVVQGAKPDAGASGKTGPISAVINFRTQSGYGLTNDGSIPSSYTDGVAGVAAYFFSGTGNAGLESGATRRLHLDLSYPASAGPSPFATSSVNIAADMNQNMLDNVAGQLTCCSAAGLKTILNGDDPRYGSVSLFFPDPQGRNLQWQIVWGPGMGSCLLTSVDPGNSVWTVETASGAPLIPGCAGSGVVGADVAELRSASTTAKKVVWSVQGRYHVPFQFTIQAK